MAHSLAIGTRNMTTATLTKKQEMQQDKENARAFLRSVFDKQERPTVYTVLRHVSSSGMSRDISLFTMHEGQILNITWYASRASSVCSSLKERNGFNVIRVGGCGMDMGFHAVYSLSCSLYCPDKYDHDSAYKLDQRWL